MQNNKHFVVSPLFLNKTYLKYSSKSDFDEYNKSFIDYNALVDSILEIAPPNKTTKKMLFDQELKKKNENLQVNLEEINNDNFNIEKMLKDSYLHSNLEQNKSFLDYLKNVITGENSNNANNNKFNIENNTPINIENTSNNYLNFEEFNENSFCKQKKYNIL